MFLSCLYNRKKHILCTALLLSSVASADISGIVYTDFNLNGNKDINDVLLKGVTVLAVCEDGNTYNTITNANGQYIIEGFPSGEYCRIEADPSSKGLDSASNSSNSSPLVDRVEDGTTDHDISVASSGTYCQANPDVLSIAVPALTTLSSSDVALPDNYPTLIQTVQPTGATVNGQGTIANNTNRRSYFYKTGATWGLAYKRDTHETFMAASIKTYSNFGAGGIGAIYKVDTSDNITLFATIPDAASTALNNIIDNTPRNVIEDYDDDNIYPYVGREGLGDIDISEDYQTLYVLNMNTKSIVEVDANDGSIIKTVPIPNPYNNTCPATDVRPWALTVKGNDVYIGSVCESKISGSDGGLGASAQKYNGAIIQEVARNNTLDFLRPKWKNPTVEANENYNFKSWAPATEEGNGKTTPILTDLSFDSKGNLILAYMNRSAFMRRGAGLKYRLLGGDIRKMCLNDDNTYTDESTAALPTSCSSHTVQYNGNSDVYNEFYTGDFFGTNLGESGHPETITGALAQEAGKPYILTSMVDGTEFDEPGAIAQLSHITGEKLGVQALLKDRVNDSDEAAVFGRKAGGLGDIELICDPAPIEIGNYVWIDFNEDGIQDPDESPLKDITVTLWDGATQIGETSTDNIGHYYFGGLDNAHTNGNSITSHHSYSVKIAKSQSDITTVTTSNPNDPADDIRDNDALDDGTDLVIDFQTKANNDHSLDFGIKPVKIGNRVWIEDDNDGDATTGNITPVGGATVTATCDGVEYTAVTDDNTGLYQIAVPANANCSCVKVATPADTIPTHGSDDNSVTDTTSEENKSHDGTCTSVAMGTIDNMTLDFGFIITNTSIKIEKATNNKDADTVADAKILNYGDNVTWSYVITNTGNEPLKNISATDDKEGGIICPQSTLAIDETMTCTSKTGTANVKNYVNKATVTAKGAVSNNDTDDDDLSHYQINATPKIKIEKATNNKDADTVADAKELHYGNTVTWSYVVTNTGDEPLQNIVAIDDKEGGITCPTPTLAINESMICTSKTGTANVATYENKASVSAKGLISTNNTSDDDLSHYKIDATPKIKIEKATNSKDADTVADAKELYFGDTVTWSYVITNTGDEPLQNIAATDDKEGGITCPKQTLAIGETMTCTSKTGTANVAAYENKATVTAIGVVSSKDTEDDDLSHYKTYVKIGNKVWIENDNDGDATTGAITPVAGTTVNATCNGVDYSAITDSHGLYSITVPVNVNCTCVKVATPIDTIPTHGSDDNSVTDTTSEENKSHDGTCTSVAMGTFDNMTLDFGFFVSSPKITIEKSTNLIDADTASDAVELSYGDALTWNYVVSNTGDEPLKDITVIDDKIGLITCPSSTLAIGASMTCTPKSGTATKLTYVNKASVSAKGEFSDKTTLDDDFSHYKLLQVKIGNRVWIETDNDGDATTGSITPVVGTSVRAICTGINYTTTTDSNGFYSITVPANIGTCILEVNTPNGTTPSQGSDDNTVNDTTSEENKTHDGKGTSVTVGNSDNMTIDFGFYEKPDRFDLALTKRLIKSGTYTQGDIVTFSITVINQGTLSASNIQISDYIPTGLTLHDSKWKMSGNKAVLKTPIASIAKGTSKSVTIAFIIKENFYGSKIINNAEIASANGGTDIDSHPSSETGAIPDCNNHITSEKNGKDDYDCAEITIIPSQIQPTPTPTPAPHAKPNRPQSVKITDTDNGVVLSWADTSSNESGFKIYQDGTLIAIVGADKTSYTIENLDANTPYTFTIKAYNGNGESSESIITFTTKDDYGWMIPAIHYPLLLQ